MSQLHHQRLPQGHGIGKDSTLPARTPCTATLLARLHSTLLSKTETLEGFENRSAEKVARMQLAAKVISALWEEISAYRSKHPPFGLSDHPAPEQFVLMTDTETQRRIEAAPDFRQAVFILKSGMGNTLLTYTHPDYIENNFLPKLIAKKVGGKNLQATIAQYSQHLAHGESEIKSPTIAEHVFTGFYNGNRLIWKVIETIPAVFAAQHGRAITKEEFLELQRKSKALIVTLAGSHIEVIQRLENVTRQVLDLNCDWLDPRFLHIIGGAKHATLELHPEAFKYAHFRDLRLKTAQTGCIALNAAAPPRSNVFSATIDWAFAVSEHYLTKRAELTKR
jgi:hypothetical protein